jgi:hypothetical protein
VLPKTIKFEYQENSCSCCKKNGKEGNCINCPALKYTGKKCFESGWCDLLNSLCEEDIEKSLKASNKILRWLRKAEKECIKHGNTSTT